MANIINILKCDSLQESKEEFRKVVQKAVDDHDGHYFTVGLSGGSLPAILAEVLPTINTEWKKWRFFFCDERLVSFSDPESTFGAYRSIVVPKISEISLNQFITIDPSLNSWAAANDYLSKMKQIFSRKTEIDFPRFDLLFLGMGPDGHTCSLFPNHPLLKVSYTVMYVIFCNRNCFFISFHFTKLTKKKFLGNKTMDCICWRFTKSRSKFFFYFIHCYV